MPVTAVLPPASGLPAAAGALAPAAALAAPEAVVSGAVLRLGRCCGRLLLICWRCCCCSCAACISARACSAKHKEQSRVSAATPVALHMVGDGARPNAVLSSQATVPLAVQPAPVMCAA